MTLAVVAKTPFKLRFAPRSQGHRQLRSQGTSQCFRASYVQAIAVQLADFRSPVDQRCLGSPHRVRPISGRIESDRLHPAGNYASVLTGRQVWRIGNAGWEQILVAGEFAAVDPRKHRLRVRSVISN